jgi:hypothetical protein
MQALDRKEHYPRMAGECLKLAHDSDDPTNKALHLEMAPSWVKLAELTRDQSEVHPETDR